MSAEPKICAKCKHREQQAKGHEASMLGMFTDEQGGPQGGTEKMTRNEDRDVARADCVGAGLLCFGLTLDEMGFFLVGRVLGLV